MLYSAVNTLKKLLINNELKDFDPVKEAFKAFFFYLVLWFEIQADHSFKLSPFIAMTFQAKGAFKAVVVLEL